MWLFQSKEKKQAIAEARQVFADATTSFATADPTAALGLAKSVSANESLGLLSQDERTALMDKAFNAYADNVLADDIFTAEEEESFNAVAAALGYSGESLARHPDLLSRLYVARVNDGRLVEVEESRVIRKRGEVVYLETAAELLKEVAKREFRGGSQGLSFPIGNKGVRYRVGGFRGRMVTVGSEMQVQDSGLFSVTSQRIAYLGSAKSNELLFTKLMGMEVFTDGLRLQASNRQNALLFRFTQGVSGDAVAATINAAIQRSPG